jgi:hypothetical protein
MVREYRRDCRQPRWWGGRLNMKFLSSPFEIESTLKRLLRRCKQLRWAVAVIAKYTTPRALTTPTAFLSIKDVWSEILVGLTEEMDYDNFKSEVGRHQDIDGAEYEHSLHEVWSVMNRLQK